VLQERLINIVRRFAQRRVVVVGDAIADRFVYGSISRVSREAPVFILRHEQTETIPGGAANCAVNISSLGAEVSLVSLIGEDEAGHAMAQRLEAFGVNCESLLRSETVKTVTKLRVLAGQVHSTRQQVIRIDYDSEAAVDPGLRKSVAAAVRKQMANAEAVIISDYNYGLANDEVKAVIRETMQQRSIPVFVDSRFHLASFDGFTSATPNEDEVEHLLAGPVSDQAHLAEAAERLRAQLGFRALLVTRGSHGMMLLENGGPPLNIAAVGGSEPVDVTGAGDTVIATYSLALASDASFADAARLANHAGGLVVMKRGTASVTASELERSVLQSETS
jgi:rfaE bifunctional protein kinase chain/domain